MKKVLATVLATVLISLLSTLGLVSCSPTNNDSSVKMVDNYASIDDLIKDSPFIVTGVVESNNNEFVYGEVPFAITKFKIETTIRGEVSGTINILQTKIPEDPFIKKSDKMVLFLIKYTGPVTEDAYRMKGLYLGQYKIVGDTVVKNSNNNLAGDEEVLTSLDLLISRINLLGYEPNAPIITK
ncbi:MAG: hypothetical protein JW967_00820 [Dehalococcoidales bacterium]|nr:hypothetical protein [Dehalococcoidales bacterium]